MNNIQLYNNDCLIKLKELEENSVDSIVTDPPYEISFMSKGWDGTGIAFNTEVWKECLRVLKPGGHILAFGATRTYHRMTVAIEDAGFEIRDCLFWCYGSGFPKSHNIGKAVQKQTGDIKVIGKKKGAGSTGKTYISAQKFDAELDKGVFKKEYDEIEITNEYEGFGTALKPAVEPVVMGRKPFKGNVAANVLEWGTGGLNIDGCRIGTDDNLGRMVSKNDLGAGQYGLNDGRKTKPTNKMAGTFRDLTKGLGRWPANLILDEQAGKMLDEQSGIQKSGVAVGGKGKASSIYGTKLDRAGGDDIGYDDTGGASRFFYCPKVSKKERGKGNNHPTVKPVALLSYLIRLVTPKGGIVLDPFMGSGSTGKAAIKEGMGFVGIEKEEEYFGIAQARIQHEAGQHKYREFF